MEKTEEIRLNNLKLEFEKNSDIFDSVFSLLGFSAGYTPWNTLEASAGTSCVNADYGFFKDGVVATFPFSSGELKYTSKNIRSGKCMIQYCPVLENPDNRAGISFVFSDLNAKFKTQTINMKTEKKNDDGETVVNITRLSNGKDNFFAEFTSQNRTRGTLVYGYFSMERLDKPVDDKTRLKPSYKMVRKAFLEDRTWQELVITILEDPTTDRTRFHYEMQSSDGKGKTIKDEDYYNQEIKNMDEERTAEPISEFDFIEQQYERIDCYFPGFKDYIERTWRQKSFGSTAKLPPVAYRKEFPF